MSSSISESFSETQVTEKQQGAAIRLGVRLKLWSYRVELAARRADFTGPDYCAAIRHCDRMRAHALPLLSHEGRRLLQLRLAFEGFTCSDIANDVDAEFADSLVEEYRLVNRDRDWKPEELTARRNKLGQQQFGWIEERVARAIEHFDEFRDWIELGMNITHLIFPTPLWKNLDELRQPGQIDCPGPVPSFHHGEGWPRSLPPLRKLVSDSVKQIVKPELVSASQRTTQGPGASEQSGSHHLLSPSDVPAIVPEFEQTVSGVQDVPACNPANIEQDTKESQARITAERAVTSIQPTLDESPIPQRVSTINGQRFGFSRIRAASTWPFLPIQRPALSASLLEIRIQFEALKLQWPDLASETNPISVAIQLLRGALQSFHNTTQAPQETVHELPPQPADSSSQETASESAAQQTQPDFTEPGYLGLSFSTNRDGPYLVRRSENDHIVDLKKKIHWKFLQEFVDGSTGLAADDLHSFDHVAENWQAYGMKDKPAVASSRCIQLASDIRKLIRPLCVNFKSVSGHGYRLLEILDKATSPSPRT